MCTKILEEITESSCVLKDLYSAAYFVYYWSDSDRNVGKRDTFIRIEMCEKISGKKGVADLILLVWVCYVK